MEQTFRYKAVGADGQTVKGTGSAESLEALMEDLAREGLTLLSRPTASSSGSRERSGKSVKLKAVDVAELASYIALTCRAGLSVVDAIEDFCEDRPPAIQELLRGVVEDVRGGMTLNDAFGARPRSFNPTFQAMVRAGEQSGALDDAMEGAGKQIAFQVAVRSKLRQAMIQPAILVLCVLGLVVLLLTYLLPRIMGMIIEADVELPASTAFLMAASDFLRAHWVPLTSGLVVLIVGFKLILSTTRGRLAFDWVLLRVPVLGGLVRMSAEARFVSTMSTLLRSGIDAVRSLRMAADTTGSAEIGARLHAAADRVSEGETLTRAVTMETQLHPLVRRMIQLGESSGSLHETLGSAVTYLSEELPRRVQRVVSVIEPVIIVCSGVVVAFILLSALLPVFSLYESY